MITTTTRSCGLCGAMLDEDPACPRCSAPVVPPVATWPLHWRRWLVGQHVAMALAPYPTDQAKWEWLVRSVVTGRQWGTVVVPRACTTLDAFALAVKQADAWESNGSMRLF